MKTTVYDTTKFAARIGELWSLRGIKQIMLEAIGNVTVAVRDNDADRAIRALSDLMWVYEIFSTIEEKEVEV